MRIDLVGLWYWPVIGGTETFMFELAKGLIGRGHEVVIHTCLLDQNNKKISEGPTQLLPQSSIQVYRYKPFLWSKKMLPTYGKLFKANLADADVVCPQTWARGASDYNAWVAKGLRKPVVLVANDVDYPAPSAAADMFKKGYDRFASKILTKLYDIVAIETDYDRPFLIKAGFPDDRIVAPGSGIGSEPFMVHGKKALTKFKLEECNYLLFVGRVAEEKSVRHLLKAAKGVNMPVAIAGKGPQVEHLRELGNKLGVDTRLLGFISEEEKFELMSNCFAFVNPSRHEAFGLTPLEAYATGCPVIASRVGGVPYVFGEGRALFYEYGDIAGLRARIDELANVREQYKPDLDHARQYTWEEVTLRYEKIFQQALRNNK